MNWDYKISEPALKQLKKLDKKAAARIIRYLDDRVVGTEDPRQWGKQLKGELNNIWRYRSGDYRILCQLQDEVFIVLVLKAGHLRVKSYNLNPTHGAPEKRTPLIFQAHPR